MTARSFVAVVASVGIVASCGAAPREPVRSNAHATSTPMRVEPRIGVADDAVVSWLRDHLAPLATDDPAAATDDLRAVRRIVGDATVVGLGEATHGTREFFRLKHRILEALAEDGSCTLAMEADFADGLAIGRYVDGRDADLHAALDKLYLVWRTEEVAALLAWMRAANVDPARPRKIRFFGFDAQSPRSALVAVREFLQRVDAKALEALGALAPLERGGDDAADAYRALPDDVRARARGALADAIVRFDLRREAYTKRSSDAEWASMRQALVTAQQAERVMSAVTGKDRFLARDRAMADNVGWIAKTGAPESRVVVWAHNGHVVHPSDAMTMGTNLREAFGSSYVAIGLFFDRGGFQTFDFSGGRFRWKETVLGPSPDAFATASFTKTGVPLFIVDLRSAKPPAVASWLADERPIREVGHTFESEEAASRGARLVDEVDAALFVAETTRARPAKR